MSSMSLWKQFQLLQIYISTKLKIVLTLGTMKLLQSTEKKTTKDKNGENVPQLK